MQALHSINIFTHVLFGTIALILASIALLAPKRSRYHTRFGRYFLIALLVVIATGFIGSLFFRSNPFLLMLTLLAGYNGYAGYRIIRLRQRRASYPDMLVAVGVLVAGLLFLVYVNQPGSNWSPAVIYPTLSALVIVTGYDLLKYFIWFEQLKTGWLYEHIYKMVSAFSALLSAFSGTVFPDYKPYSQILPSVFCLLLIAYFFRKVSVKSFHSSSSVPVNTVAPARRYQ